MYSSIAQLGGFLAPGSKLFGEVGNVYMISLSLGNLHILLLLLRLMGKA
jgi:hypothetical protein